MSLESRIKSISEIRNFLNQFLNHLNTGNPRFQDFDRVISMAEQKNSWFTQENIFNALNYWDKVLEESNVNQWLSRYSLNENKNKTIGLVLAGNIPMVGFHDCLCCLLLGYKTKIKLSSKDNVLIPFFLNLWKETCNDLDFSFVEIIKDCDAVITTGSNNTARYFEYYFKDIPHIIRKNRTSIAVINGNEKQEDLEKLAKDVFTYFGLGCRNVTQLLVPADYNLNQLFESFLSYKDLIRHNKYSNNYDYNKAIYLLNKDKFWDNNLILLKESDNLYSAIGSLNVKFYKDHNEINTYIRENINDIQCIVSLNNEINGLETVPFGYTQKPELYNYSDGIDTIKFLLEI
ncbi:acyl-CoA reductase [Apibacter muscae]|uniref:acyl-CoA reductase n=1 Tax=Apibacter muscae TaxID=2509004 RepID=UPI0011ABC0E3|nr:acyl-CoA reductase [Apibacter muscae]TWP22533.1 acyl-CoA reductase [Apibacter muscae]